jgi:hypothetical protein
MNGIINEGTSMGRRGGREGYRVPHCHTKLLTLKKVLGNRTLETEGKLKRNYINRYLSYNDRTDEFGYPGRETVETMCKGIGLSMAHFITHDLGEFAEAVAGLELSRLSKEEISKIVAEYKCYIDSEYAKHRKEKDKKIQGDWYGWSINVPLEYLNTIDSTCAYEVEARFEEEFLPDGEIQMKIYEKITRSYHILSGKEVESKRITEFDGIGSRKVGSRDIKLVFHGLSKSDIDGVLLLNVDRLYREIQGYACYLDPKAEAPALAKVVLRSKEEKKLTWMEAMPETIRILARYMQKKYQMPSAKTKSRPS